MSIATIAVVILIIVIVICYYHRTCLSVCLSICPSVLSVFSNITGKRMNRLSWNFQDSSDIVQETNWNILGMLDIFSLFFLRESLYWKYDIAAITTKRFHWSCIHSLFIFMEQECAYLSSYGSIEFTLHWRHNDYDGVSNRRPRGCLLNRLFRRRSKKTSKLRVTGLCAGNSPGPVNSPHKWPVTRKMFPFDDVIM